MTFLGLFHHHSSSSPPPLHRAKLTECEIAWTDIDVNKAKERIPLEAGNSSKDLQVQFLPRSKHNVY